MKKILKTTAFFLPAAIVFFLLVGFMNIQPVAWKPPVPADTKYSSTLNEKLAQSQTISLGGWYGPEDIVFDSIGNMYCGVHRKEKDFSSGAILKISRAGTIEVFYDAKSWVSGLHFDKEGNLIALSHKQGLISISPERKVTVLAKEDEYNMPFLIPNGLDIAADGKIYFSNTSQESAYNIEYGRKIILEMLPLGGLYCYDPATKKVKTLIDGSYFGNGVVLSREENYVLMVETSKYRILRYWLRGEKAGQVETFVDNLPGFPNGISIREDGSYWVGFSTKRNGDLDKIHATPVMKRIVYALPQFMQPKAEKFGMVLNISTEGRIVQSFFDTKGIVLPEAGAVKERDGYLYIGGDVLPHVGRLKI